MRRVSKLWKSEIDRLRIKELVIKWKRKPDKWFLSPDSINRANRIEMDVFDSNNLKFLKQMTNLPLLDQLKRLKITSGNFQPECGGLHIFLLKFTSLEELEIECWLKRDNSISHPNLRKLTIDLDVDKMKDRSLEIVCPRLAALGFRGCFDPVNVIYAETLVYLSARFSFAKFDTLELGLKPFKSLEYLVLRCTGPYFLTTVQLVYHPQLKVCKFKITDLKADQYRAVREALVDLLEQKERLGQTNLKIYFGKTLLTNVDQFVEIDKQYCFIYYSDDSDEIQD